jgi:hypothetical protein
MASLWTGQWQGGWEGRLIGPIDPNFLTGTAGFHLASSGLINGAGILAGQAYFAFDALGNIENGNTTIPAYGTAGLSLSASGALIGALLASGAASIVLDAQGDAYLATNAAGTSLLEVGASGSLRGIGAIIGAGAVDLAVQATLRGVGSVVGASGIAVLPNGNIFSPLWADGSTSISLGVSGDINGAVWAAGEADVSLQSSGLMHGIGALSGAAWVALRTRYFDMGRYQRVYAKAVIDSLFVASISDQIISVAAVKNLSVLDSMQVIGVRTEPATMFVQKKRVVRTEKQQRTVTQPKETKLRENKPAYATAEMQACRAFSESQSIFSCSAQQSLSAFSSGDVLFVQHKPRRSALETS